MLFKLLILISVMFVVVVMRFSSTTRRRVAEVLLVVASLVWLWKVGATWWARWDYPYDLEWMEGGMLAHAWRLLQGLPIYVEPGPDFVPYIYPPGYAAILALLGGVLGLTPELGRSLSIAGTLAATAAIGVSVFRHGGSKVVGLVAAVCFVGTYTWNGAFFDLIRPDALCMGLLAWSLVIGLEREPGSEVASGLLLCAAFLCKHNVAAFGLPLWGFIWATRGRGPALRFLAASALPALASVGALQWASEGRFLTYILEVPGSHPMVSERILPGVPGELARVVPVPLLICVSGWVWIVLNRVKGRTRWMFGGLMALGGMGLGVAAHLLPDPKGVLMPHDLIVVLASLGIGAAVVGLLLVFVGPWRSRDDLPVLGFVSGVAWVGLTLTALMRGHHGGFLNVYIPLHWLLCLGMGILLARWHRAGGIRSALAIVALSVQVSWVFVHEDLQRLIPTADDVAAGDLVVETLAECEGEVWSPFAAWLPTYAGFEPHGHLIALWDVNHKKGPFFSSIGAVQQGVRDGVYGCVLDGGKNRLKYGVPDHYQMHQRFNFPGRALTPMSGWRVRPTYLLVPRHTSE
jgi:hypothetical protein